MTSQRHMTSQASQLLSSEKPPTEKADERRIEVIEEQLDEIQQKRLREAQLHELWVRATLDEE